MEKKRTKGTKEWATSNINICDGCSNDCRYCYAKKMAIRFGRKTNDSWKIMEIREKAVKKKYRKRTGRIMAFSAHDITPENYEACRDTLRKLVIAGNEVLITTKPNRFCIEQLCKDLEVASDFAKRRILFRFTIGSKNNEVLKYWEPGAPSFEDRLNALIFATNAGYSTSISIEPYLDRDVLDLVAILYPYVTDTIWIGKMSNIPKVEHNLAKEMYVPLEIKTDWQWETEMRDFTKPSVILEMVKEIEESPFADKIRWKDSITMIICKNKNTICPLCKQVTKNIRIHEKDECPYADVSEKGFEL